MGEILKSRFKFTSLKGIRKAYSIAFSERIKWARTDRLDEILSNKFLDATALIRNLLVHKSGKADQDYLDDSKDVPQAPQLKLDEQLEVTGDLVISLVEPVTSACADLIREVNKWSKLTKDHYGDRRTITVTLNNPGKTVWEMRHKGMEQ